MTDPEFYAVPPYDPTWNTYPTTPPAAATVSARCSHCGNLVVGEMRVLPDDSHMTRCARCHKRVALPYWTPAERQAQRLDRRARRRMRKDLASTAAGPER